MILIQDNLHSPEILDSIRASAIAGGFGNMHMTGTLLGDNVYSGVGFHGRQSEINMSISALLARPIFPNISFFRIYTEKTEKRIIHSDLNDGTFTAITYLSTHPDSDSGTAFYRHKKTGLTEMPCLSKMKEEGSAETWNADMHDPSKWDQTDYVSGQFGRILIFSAPLFHGRIPEFGIGKSPEDARMIHVCHFVV